VLRSIDAALVVGNQFGLECPTLICSIYQLSADGDTLVGLESGGADGSRLIYHYALGNNLDGLSACERKAREDCGRE
jgi:hypothetical protein